MRFWIVMTKDGAPLSVFDDKEEARRSIEIDIEVFGETKQWILEVMPTNEVDS